MAQYVHPNERIQMIYATLYSSDTRGKILSWWMETDGEGSFRGHSRKGEEGKVNTTGWTLCKPKNVGKSNETTIIEQASLEVGARYRKKLKKHHHTDKEQYLTKHYTEPMLAQKYDKSIWETHTHRVSQPKLDGFRCLPSARGAYSRAGEKFHSIPHIVGSLAPMFEKYPMLELDGELYNHELRDSFEELSSIIRKENVTEADLQKSEELIQFHVYDIASSTGQDYMARHREIAALFNEFPCKYVRLVPFDEVSSHVQTRQMLEQYLQAGYEGAMIRTVAHHYRTFHRSESLLKYKLFVDEEFEIVAVLPGLGSWSEYAKHLTVQFADGRQFNSGIKGNFAFTKKLLRDKGKHVGKMVTIKYFALTNDGIPRFPVAIKFHK